MKTADLIPLLLHELDISDQYGFELTKAIETKTKGAVVIKQPTLYTLLKRLEKSKFISSYWQDSEIGGKRHYYKLTENGKIQLSTLPSYQEILHIISANVDENEDTNSVTTTPIESNLEIKESIIPTNEVFNNNSIDNVTELELNTTNSNILKDSVVVNNEQFASNENVTKFTEKLSFAKPILTNANEETLNNLDSNYSTREHNNDVKFVDYVDIKNNENYKTSKKVATKLTLVSLATSASIILVLSICGFITGIVGSSWLYYCFLLTGTLVAIFYPICMAINYDKIRLKYQTIQYKSKDKHKFMLNSVVTLLVVCLCFVVSIKMYNKTILSTLHFSNFTNFYAPVLITLTLFLDILFNNLIMKSKK